MRTIALLLTAALVVASSAAFAAEPALRATKDNTTVSVFVGETPRLTYRFADVPYKPCVKTFCTPSGINILRDSPHDHVHHHALMFAISAEGVSFWVERGKVGSQVNREIKETAKTLPGGVSAAVIDEKLDWMLPDKKPAMSERRAITTYAAKDLKPSLLTWQTELTPAEGKPSVKLGGSHYYGLGMRFVQSMDTGGRFFSASGKKGPTVRGKERLTPAKWMAYTAAADGKKVTVAMFDHPDNPRHPAKMFTMSAPFAYISATLNLWKEPMTIEAGKPLVLRYGVALWDGEVTAEKVEKVYQKWVAFE